MDEQAIERKKDKECIYCEHFFNCMGKPKDLERKNYFLKLKLK